MFSFCFIFYFFSSTFTECVATETETDINIVAAYTSSCKKNEAEPVEHIIEQLKVIAHISFSH